MDLELSDKVVVITGGSDGLGAAAAHVALREGARVAICGRDEQKLHDRAEALRAVGGDVLAVRADVTRPTDIIRFLEAAHDRWGRVDALVNNAGASSAGAFVDVTDDKWEADLGLKLMAAIRAARTAFPMLRERGGSIVNVLSITARTPGARSMPTSVSRAAGLALTKALSREWGPDGIRVNAVLIGMVRSGQWERMAQARGSSVDELLAARAAESGIPLRRVASAEEFGDLVAFLVSPRGSYLTGTAIAFDGGLSTTI